jgi:hypothetical protein
MFRRSTDGIAISTSIRLNDGSILIGTINCGVSGKLENILTSDVAFIEFVSKDGQQRFISHHQVASIEPLASISEPQLPAIETDNDAFSVLGIAINDTQDTAKSAFQHKLKLYNPERWSGPDVPFEFSRYAAEKTRQINMAFTIARAALQNHAEKQRLAKSQQPLFGSLRATA